MEFSRSVLPDGRFTLIDGLRGLAALAVAEFHFYMALLNERFVPLPRIVAVVGRPCFATTTSASIFFRAQRIRDRP